MTDNLSGLLSQVSTIAYVKCRALGLWRLDRQASKQADRLHGAIDGASKTQVSRMAGAEKKVDDITDIHAAAGALLKEMTTAWGDRRLLPNTMLEKFMNPYADLKREHDEKVEEFIREAPALLVEAENNKGTFNVKIPTMAEIEKAFGMDFRLEPVPDVSTYKSGNLDKAVEKILKERFEQNIKAAYTEAQADAIKRIAKPLSLLVDGMAKYDKREAEKARGLSVDKTGTFKNSIIGNVQEIAEVFGEWNLTGDPLMQRLDDALSAFANIDGEDLKTSPELRKDVSDRAAKILDEIRAGGYL